MIGKVHNNYLESKFDGRDKGTSVGRGRSRGRGVEPRLGKKGSHRSGQWEGDRKG